MTNNHLFEKMMESCVIMDKTTTSDGEGGYIESWNEGAEIMAAIVNDTSIQARIAEGEGFTNTYTITTPKTTILDFHTVIKRKSDGLILRVTADGNAKQTPTVATFDFASVAAEKWSLT